MKTNVRIFVVSAACVIGAYGCSKDEPDPPASSAHEGGESYAEHEPGGAVEVEEPRRAEATFESASGSELEGEASLAETAEGVQVSAKVESAPPGTLEVVLRSTDDCSNVIGEGAGKEDPAAAEAQLATFAINNEGKGELMTTVSGANLNGKGEPMSLLGKALVIRELPSAPQDVPGHGQAPIACAKIEKD
jgi:hypothetical protein